MRCEDQNPSTHILVLLYDEKVCGKLVYALVEAISVTSLCEDKFLENVNSQGRWGEKIC